MILGRRRSSHQTSKVFAIARLSVSGFSSRRFRRHKILIYKQRNYLDQTVYRQCLPFAWRSKRSLSSSLLGTPRTFQHGRASVAQRAYRKVSDTLTYLVTSTVSTPSMHAFFLQQSILEKPKFRCFRFRRPRYSRFMVGWNSSLRIFFLHSSV